MRSNFSNFPFTGSAFWVSLVKTVSPKAGD